MHRELRVVSAQSINRGSLAHRCLVAGGAYCVFIEEAQGVTSRHWLSIEGLPPCTPKTIIAAFAIWGRPPIALMEVAYIE